MTSTFPVAVLLILPAVAIIGWAGELRRLWIRYRARGLR